MIPLSTITLVESASDGTGKRRESQHEVNALFTEDPARVLGTWAELRAPKTRAQLIVRWDQGGPVLDGVCETIRAISTAESARAADATDPVSVDRTGTHSPVRSSEIELAALSVYTAAKALLIAQERGPCELEREAALDAYRAFTKRWGSLRAAFHLAKRGQPAGVLAATPLADHPETLFLESLETDRGRPSELLAGTPLVIRGSGLVFCTLAEALSEYLDLTGRVDLDGVGAVAGLTGAEAEQALLADRLCYRVPPGCVSHLAGYQAGSLVPTARYLAGDIKTKLVTAAAAGPRYAANANALREVLPHRVELPDIGAGLGADWIPQRVTEDWLYSLYPGENWGVGLERVSGSTLLSVTNPRLVDQDTLRTDRVTGIEILEAAVNCRLPIVEDAPTREGGRPRRNHGATAEAQIRAQDVRQRFESWIASDAVGKSGQARREAMESAYADRFRRFAPRDAERQRLTFPGLASVVGGKRYALRPGQLRGVAQILSGGTYDRSSLLAYPPGYGKTDPAICASVKLRQWGLASRTVVAVPAGVAGQWAARWRALSPGSADEVLGWTCPRFGVSVGGLAGFLRRAASGAWPYVVLTHEALGALLPRSETLAVVTERELSDLRHAVREAEHDMSRAAQAVARAELRGRSAELGRLLAAVEDRRRAELPSWDDMGCDHLVVDEVQNFKALPVATRMEGVAGLPTRESSRAVGLYLKCQALLGSTRGRVTTLSGTPLTNTLAEAYVWMRFLQPRLLREVGLLHFDSWASVFCEPYAAVEMDCVGRFRSRTRLRFRNVPELLSLLGECWSFARED